MDCAQYYFVQSLVCPSPYPLPTDVGERDSGVFMSNKSYTTTLALMAAIVMWSSAFIGIRIGIKDYQAGSFALLRLGIAAICMAFLYVMNPPKKAIALKDKLHAAI